MIPNIKNKLPTNYKMTGHRPNDWGSVSSTDRDFFLFATVPDWPWDLPNLLSTGYWEFFSYSGKAAGMLR
jgi:hypothetical protein